MYSDGKGPRVEGEVRTEMTWARELGQGEGDVTSARPDGEATGVSTRWDVAKDSLVTEGVNRPDNS